MTYHPVNEIFGTKSDVLAGKHILVCCTGSIAVFESLHLVRELIRHSGKVTVALSEAAMELVSPMTFEWATGKQPITEIKGQVEHVSLVAKEAEERVTACIISPATTNTLAKIASGIADTVVTLLACTVLGSGIPLIATTVAHQTLIDNPFVKKQIEKLKAEGVIFVPPRIEEGKAKIPTVESHLQVLFTVLNINQNLRGKRVLITGGATREYLDPVRFISNPSSGRTALEFAQAARRAGAEVKLVVGEGHTVDFANFDCLIVRSTADMVNGVLKVLAEAEGEGKAFDILISAAAISDYTASKSKEKIKSMKDKLVLELQPTPKLLQKVREKYKDLFMVGFKAETGVSDQELANSARKLLEKYNLQLVIANDIERQGAGFAVPTNEVLIISREKKKIKKSGTKKEIASEVIALIAKKI